MCIASCNIYITIYFHHSPIHSPTFPQCFHVCPQTATPGGHPVLLALVLGHRIWQLEQRQSHDPGDVVAHWPVVMA